MEMSNVQKPRGVNACMANYGPIFKQGFWNHDLVGGRMSGLRNYLTGSRNYLLR